MRVVRSTACSLAAAALLLAASSVPAPAATSLAATVTWVASDGSSATALFQGKAEGSVLHGTLYAGDDQIAVEGTIASDGTVSGTVTSPDGTALGSFSGTLDAAQQLQGTYTLIGSGGGTWSSPAEKLPLPAP